MSVLTNESRHVTINDSLFVCCSLHVLQVFVEYGVGSRIKSLPATLKCYSLQAHTHKISAENNTKTLRFHTQFGIDRKKTAATATQSE